jgi:hypothetical protein
VPLRQPPGSNLKCVRNPSSGCKAGLRSSTRGSTPVLTTRTLSGSPCDRALPLSSGSVRRAYQGQALGALCSARRTVLRAPRQVLDSNHAIEGSSAPLRPGMISRPDPAILPPAFSADEFYRQRVPDAQMTLLPYSGMRIVHGRASRTSNANSW